MVQARPAMASQVIGRSCQAGRVPASLRCCLILTAHAHRKKAAVGAITRTNTNMTTRMGLLLAGSAPLQWRIIVEPQRRRRHWSGALPAMKVHALPIRGEDELQIFKHTRRRAPDVALAVGHGVVEPFAALPDAAGEPMVLLVEEVLQGHLEDVGDLARVCTGGE